MGSRRYAVLTTLEWSDRKPDGTSTETRVEAGELRSDIPAASVRPLLQSKAIEPYAATKHKPGWWEKRQREAADRAAAGRVAGAEPVDKAINVSDSATSRETR